MQEDGPSASGITDKSAASVTNPMVEEHLMVATQGRGQGATEVPPPQMAREESARSRQVQTAFGRDSRDVAPAKVGPPSKSRRTRLLSIKLNASKKAATGSAKNGTQKQRAASPGDSEVQSNASREQPQAHQQYQNPRFVLSSYQNQLD